MRRRHQAAVAFYEAARNFAEHPGDDLWGSVETAAWAWIGWRRRKTWLVHLEADPPILTRWAAQRARERSVSDRRRTIQHERGRAEGLAFLADLRRTLRAHGIHVSMTRDQLRHLDAMLPAPYAVPREAFAACKDPIAWTGEEAGDPTHPIPADILLEAWHDRWVTARSIAAALAISQRNAKRIMHAVGTHEVPNPHDASAAPMLLSRMARVEAWAHTHAEELELWQKTLRTRRERRAERERAEVEQLRALPERLAQETDDPTPIVCFWLSLLNRAAKTPGQDANKLYRLKDDALQALLEAGVSCHMEFVPGGDLPGEVRLCDDCRRDARVIDMHPLD